MTFIELALKLRPIIEKAMQSLSEEDALEAVTLYPKWEPSTEYNVVGHRLRHENVLYSVIQPHTSQDDWTPDVAVSLFSKVLIPDTNAIPDWIQPDSTNPYQIGDKVAHNDKVWVSDYNNNVWEPGVFGWHESVQ